jgi:hypothetical protein
MQRLTTTHVRRLDLTETEKPGNHLIPLPTAPSAPSPVLSSRAEERKRGKACPRLALVEPRAAEARHAGGAGHAVAMAGAAVGGLAGAGKPAAVGGGGAGLRLSLNRGRPFGDAEWQARTAARLGLEKTFRPRGRPRKQADTV